MDESILLVLIGLLWIARNKIILRMLSQHSAEFFLPRIWLAQFYLIGMVKQQVQQEDMPKMFNKFLVH